MADAPAAFAVAWQQKPAGETVLAVSGGSDSVALLRLVAATGARPPVVTVDHRLRPDSAAEAGFVATLSASLGLEHATLEWRDEPVSGNLQAAARAARYRLIGDWARARGIPTVVTGHTLDDQAETVILRLVRGSGVDGLAAMRQTSRLGGLTVFRPLLEVRREALREYLRQLGQEWRDDPSNLDFRFDRVRAREALATLAPLGLTAERLARTAAHMARAAEALEATVDEWAGRHLALRWTGEAVIDGAAWRALPDELRLRLLARALGLVAGRIYRPRFDMLSPLDAALRTGGSAGRSLHGCLIRPEAESIAVYREPAAVAPPVPARAAGTTWDNRWRVAAEGPVPKGLTVAALGEAGLAALDPAATSPEWLAAPRLARLTTPALWQGEQLVAAPLADGGAVGWRAERRTL